MIAVGRIVQLAKTKMRWNESSRDPRKLCRRTLWLVEHDGIRQTCRDSLRDALDYLRQQTTPGAWSLWMLRCRCRWSATAQEWIDVGRVPCL